MNIIKFFRNNLIFYFLFQALIGQRSPGEKSQLVRAKTNGSTLLGVAAKNGHLSCVEYLVEKCNADVEQVGSGNLKFLFYFYFKLINPY